MTSEVDSVYVFAVYMSLADLQYHILPELQVEVGKQAYSAVEDVPVLITHSPSSLTLTHWLASSNSKSCSSSMRLAYSGSFLRLLFRFLASHSGRGLAVEEPEIV